MFAEVGIVCLDQGQSTHSFIRLSSSLTDTVKGVWTVSAGQSLHTDITFMVNMSMRWMLTGSESCQRILCMMSSSIHQFDSRTACIEDRMLSSLQSNQFITLLFSAAVVHRKSAQSVLISIQVAWLSKHGIEYH